MQFPAFGLSVSIGLFADHLESGATGKIQKREIREQVTKLQKERQASALPSKL